MPSALVAGGTGLVGRRLVGLLLEAGDYDRIHVLARRPLEDDGYLIPESSNIIEYLDQKYPQTTPLILTGDPETSRKIRYNDRLCDQYLNNSFTTILFDGWKPEDKKDPQAVTEARRKLDVMYQFLDEELTGNSYLNGSQLSMADCAAVGPLFYLQQAHPFTDYSNITTYAERLFNRESWQKISQELVPALKQMGMM